MKRNWHDNLSLRVKATLVVLSATLLALSIVAAAGVIQMRQLISAEELRTVNAITQGVGHASELSLAVRDRKELSRVAEGFLNNDQIVFVAIYDDAGKLIAHSAREEQAWNRYLAGDKGNEEFVLGWQSINVNAANSEFGGDAGELAGVATQSAAPVVKGDKSTKQVGSVVVALSTSPARLAQQRHMRVTAAATVTAAILSILVTFFSVGGWTRRLNQLVGASERISEGNFTESIDDQRNDEIGRLSHAYERMREAVHQRDKELRQFNETLVQQVAERTRSLEDALHAAEAADRAKSLFLANMSHEIRTPLNGVVGMIDLLRGTDLNESQSRFAQVARSSADALLSVINDILDFSKIEAGRMDLEAANFDLPNTIENVAETASVSAARKGLEVSCYINRKVPDSVIGDSARLGQVLMNLANNAIKFTEKGQVAISATLAGQDATHAVVRFAVTDSGIGIPEDRKNRLFQSFSQVDASTTRKYGGTGLGLAISKRLVEMMGGEIGVDSQPGSGSTFWFTIRIAKGQPSASSRTVESIVANLKKVRVLGVDDSPVNREILQQQLAAWQLDVSAAPDGDTALQMLHEARRAGKPFDLAILDWHMPGMDGIELAKAIRASAEISGTALVMLTSVDDRIEGPELKSLGFASRLVKPVRQSRLLDAIAEAIGRLDANPAKTAPAQAAPAAIPVAEPRGTMQAHLLLAEDNEINQIVASEILKHAGYTLDIVSSGTDALELTFAKHFDLILMDCQMPGMDGFEATRAIREKEIGKCDTTGKPRHIPIIALTANAIKGDRELCLAAGMDDYVTKPINPVKLVEAIEQSLHNKLPARPKPEQPTASPAVSIAAEMPLDMPSLLERCLGNEALASKVLSLFVDQVGQEVGRLHQTLVDGNLEQFARAAHSVKGCAANISAEAVRKVAADLEHLGKQGNAAEAEQKLRELRAEVDRCVNFIVATKNEDRSKPNSQPVSQSNSRGNPCVP
jgi:Amt family ammonium transporter